MVPIKIAAAVAVFALIHSLTASSWFKEKVGLYFSEKFLKVYYRMIYNLFSLILTILLGTYVLIQPNYLLWRWEKLYLLLSFIRWAGILLILLSFKETDLGYFTGFGQITDYLNAKSSEQYLTARGVYGFCRHPMYLGAIMFLWSRSVMTQNFCVLSASLTIYFYVGSFFEEKRLEKQFGKEYVKYQESVPHFIPFFSFHKN